MLEEGTWEENSILENRLSEYCVIGLVTGDLQDCSRGNQVSIGVIIGPTVKPSSSTDIFEAICFVRPI